MITIDKRSAGVSPALGVRGLRPRPQAICLRHPIPPRMAALPSGFRWLIAFVFCLAQISCKDGLRPTWQWTLEGRSYGEPIIIGDTVYVTTQAGEVIAGSVRTGHKTWSTKVNDSILAAPAVSNQALFTVTEHGDIHAMDKNIGAEIWTVHIDDRFIAPVSLAHDLVLIPSETGTLYALSQNDGKQRWMQSGYRKFNTRAVVRDPYIFIGGWTGEFLCLKMDGSLNWKFKTAQLLTEEPLVFHNTVCFPAYDGFVYALQVPTGRFQWRLETRAPTSLIVVGQELIFGSERKLFVVSPQSGRILKTVVFNRPVARICGHQDQCLVVARDLYRINPSDEKVTLVARTARPIFKAAASGNMAVVSDDLHSVMAFEMEPSRR